MSIDSNREFAVLQEAMRDETASINEVPFSIIDGVGRKIQRRRRLVLSASAAATVVCLAAAGLVATKAEREGAHNVSVATTPFPGALSWPARGPFAQQPALLSNAAATWDRFAGQPHRNVSMLFAGAVATSEFVVIQGQMQDGAARIAVLSTASNGSGQGGNATTGGPLYLRGESASPGAAVAGIVFATAYMGPGTKATAPHANVVAFALAAPQATDVVLHSTAVDEQMIEGKVGNRGHQFGWATYPADSLPDNVTADIWLTGGKKSTVPLTFAGVGDGTRERAVLHRSSNVVTATMLDTSSGAKRGDLVVSTSGLVGEILSSDAGVARLRLVSDPAFRAEGKTAISDVSGTLTGQGEGRLSLDLQTKSTNEIRPTNRVLFVGTRTITVAYVTSVETQVVSLRAAAPFVDGEVVTIIGSE